MKGIAVSNSSCLIALEKINQIDIVKNSFQNIIIPPAVQHEIGFTKHWLEVKALQNSNLEKALYDTIGIGESEAIALVVENNSDYVLLDDKKARNIANRFSIELLGTIGILLRAKRLSLIAEIKPILDALHAVEFRMSHTLYQQALELAKEI